jgi:hypothetical protein
MVMHRLFYSVKHFVFGYIGVGFFPVGSKSCDFMFGAHATTSA